MGKRYYHKIRYKRFTSQITSISDSFAIHISHTILLLTLRECAEYPRFILIYYLKIYSYQTLLPASFLKIKRNSVTYRNGSGRLHAYIRDIF